MVAARVRDRCFLHRRHGRVADAPPRDCLLVLVEVVLEPALLAVGVDEELAVVELLHPSVALAVLAVLEGHDACLLYTSPSPRDATLSRMPSSA